jgi:hypothetical protein
VSHWGVRFSPRQLRLSLPRIHARHGVGFSFGLLVSEEDNRGHLLVCIDNSSTDLVLDGASDFEALRWRAGHVGWRVNESVFPRILRSIFVPNHIPGVHLLRGSTRNNEGELLEVGVNFVVANVF